MKGSIYTNSSIPKPQDSAGYIMCQAGTKWKCGVPCSICRKKSFFLSLAVSWLTVMFSVGYKVALPCAWWYPYGEGRPSEVPQAPAQQLGAQGASPDPPKSRPHLGRRATAVAGQGWGCSRPVTCPGEAERRGRYTHCELSKPQVHAPFSHWISLIKVQHQR